MFTGIIETTGEIINIVKKGNDKEFTVSSPFVNELKYGDSVSINGACQSVNRFDEKTFSFFSSMETLSLTTLNILKSGDKVNLERALKVSSRLDGHIVSGHVDGIAEIVKISKGSASYRYTFEVFDNELMRYIAKKGSIAVDGISLTVFDVSQKGFECAIIPVTIGETTLKDKKAGDKVNIETDVLSKYVERLLESGINSEKKESNITEDFLKKHGF